VQRTHPWERRLAALLHIRQVQQHSGHTRGVVVQRVVVGAVLLADAVPACRAVHVGSVVRYTLERGSFKLAVLCVAVPGLPPSTPLPNSGKMTPSCEEGTHRRICMSSWCVMFSLVHSAGRSRQAGCA